MSPVVRRQKGTHKKLLDALRKDGFTRVKIDDVLDELDETIVLDKNKNHDISLIIDRLIVKEGIESRLSDSIELASGKSGGYVDVEVNGSRTLHFSEFYACEGVDFTIPDLEPRLFSFNSPIGACDECKGLGKKLNISENLALNYEKSINEGGILPYKNQDDENLQGQELSQVCQHYQIDMDVPIKEIDRDKLDIILYGSKEKIRIKTVSSSGRIYDTMRPYEGVLTNLERRHGETTSEWIREWIESYMTESACPKCQGKRLNDAALSVKINNYDIARLTDLSVSEELELFKTIKLDKTQALIAKSILDEVIQRLTFLEDVGLGYLTLSRETLTLSGGEAQRIRLATQIGSSLSGVLYVLDEPSIGLHQRDNHMLINTLKKMRDLGNTLVVVEHDEETMLESDWLVDIGPGAGINGGYVVAEGTPEDVMKVTESITAQYLTGKKKIEVPKNRRKGSGNYLEVINARQNNCHYLFSGI